METILGLVILKSNQLNQCAMLGPLPVPWRFSAILVGALNDRSCGRPEPGGPVRRHGPRAMQKSITRPTRGIRISRERSFIGGRK